jgi:molecular chaperone GrpE
MNGKPRKRPEDAPEFGSADHPPASPNATGTEPPAPEIVEPAIPGSAGDGDATGETPRRPEQARPGSDEGGSSETAWLLEQNLEAMQRDLADATERRLRLAAEFDNYRKRSERERREMAGRAQAELARELLEALDDLERVAHHGDTSNAAALLEGVQLVEKKLRIALANAGLEEIEAERAPFDPNTMEAVAMLPVGSPEDDDVVADVFQRGYRFGGMLLRPARVRVKKYHQA